MEYVQSLLPDRQMVLRIVDYYHECMAYWCGGLWHWPSFRAKLVGAYAGGEMLELRGLDWRWNGLLCELTLHSCEDGLCFYSHVLLLHS